MFSLLRLIFAATLSLVAGTMCFGQNTAVVTITTGSGTPAPWMEVIEVSEHGLLLMREENGKQIWFRQWGIEPDVTWMRGELIGEELACRNIGTIQSPTSKFTGHGLGWRNVNVANCFVAEYIKSPSRKKYRDVPSKSLANFAIDADHAREICSETNGLFGSCR